jgi:hypothetical protein
MDVKFNVTKEERKALVKAVGEIVGLAPVYLGAPDFKFAVGSCVIDRNGTAMIGDDTGAEDVRVLLAGLTERGFVFEGDIDELAPAVSGQNDVGAGDVGGVAGHNGNDTVKSEDEPDGGAVSVTAETVGSRLSVNMPLLGFTASSLDNLEKLIAAKAWILKKMAGTDELPIKRDEKHLCFPWFRRDASAAEVDAYARLIARLCETAKEKRRVTATERRLADGDNEKFKARCFLLSLGFIGKETAQARKILLAPMSGNGSHKSGDHKKQGAPTGATTAESGAKNPEAVRARMDGSGADGEPRCGECQHHCYYTEGSLRTNAGDIVDASKRAPAQYTHYCLNTPGGFRKIKHAADWSGCETAPKWCTLSEESDNRSARNEPANAENGGYRDCLACAASFSEPAENDGDPDKLFCQERGEYVAEDGYCDEFNC